MALTLSGAPLRSLLKRHGIDVTDAVFLTTEARVRDLVATFEALDKKATADRAAREIRKDLAKLEAALTALWSRISGATTPDTPVHLQVGNPLPGLSKDVRQLVLYAYHAANKPPGTACDGFGSEARRRLLHDIASLQRFVAAASFASAHAPKDTPGRIGVGRPLRALVAGLMEVYAHLTGKNPTPSYDAVKESVYGGALDFVGDGLAVIGRPTDPAVLGEIMRDLRPRRVGTPSRQRDA